MKSFLISSMFFIISTILFSTKYISVAIILAKSDNLDSDLFRATFNILPIELTVFCVLSFFIGILFFILGFREYKKS
ncbi:hypothetical protein [Bacillus sp. FSL K6-3431]|uniref:hypothetical protein n=1 Tax=Bacillus sp. FSL K6-3431 TaxID=2921500 RepID=UPI0030F75309